MTQIAGRNAADLVDPEVQADVILELLEKLHGCSHTARPTILADLYAASVAFPERLDISHRKLYAANAKYFLSKDGPDSAKPAEADAYCIQDLEKGGPLSRIIEQAEGVRRSSGLIMPFLHIFPLCRERQRERGEEEGIRNIDDFVKELRQLDEDLASGAVTAEQLNFKRFNLASGENRTWSKDEFLTILEKSGMEPGTLIDLAGGFGYPTTSYQRDMQSKGKPFKATYLYDIATEAEVEANTNLHSYDADKGRKRWNPTETDKEAVRETITQRCYGFDLTRDNLAEAIPALSVASEPIYYHLNNVLMHYSPEINRSIFERLNDVAAARNGEEPESLLYLQHDTVANPSLLDNAIIDLKRGNIVCAPGLGLKGTDVYGVQEEPPFMPSKEELVAHIIETRKAILDIEERHSHAEHAMSDERFEELCTTHGISVTSPGKWADTVSPRRGWVRG